MKKALTTLSILLLAILTYAQPSKDEDEQKFCNEIKQQIVTKNFKEIYPLLSSNLQKDSLALSKVCNKYGKYIDTHLLNYNEYYGIEDKEDPETHYGYRWSSSENHSKCIIEITCEKINGNFVITQLIFSSKIGQLPSRAFPEGSTCIFDVNIPPPTPPLGK